MNLEQALLLLERVGREIAAGHALEQAKSPEYSFYSSDLPHNEDIYVVSKDGKAFGVMTFWGEYSDYHESVSWSGDEWDKRAADWKQVYFNPGGDWTRRLVVALEPSGLKSGYAAARLECGHAINAQGYRPTDRALQTGQRAECYQCREDGIGLTPEIVSETVERALAKEDAPRKIGGER